MDLISVDELARILQVSRDRAYSLVRRPEFGLPVVRIGRQVRLDADKLAEWIAAGGRSLERRTHRGSDNASAARVQHDGADAS